MYSHFLRADSVRCDFVKFRILIGCWKWHKKLVFVDNDKDASPKIYKKYVILILKHVSI